MESVKVNDSGQISLSPSVMKKFGIENGMEFYVFKRNGEFILTPTPLIDPIEKMRELSEGMAEELGLHSEEDVVDYIKNLRNAKK